MKSRLQDELTVFASQVGGVSELAEILDVDEDTLQKAIVGDEISRAENSDILMAFAEFEADVERQEAEGVDSEEIRDGARELADKIMYIGYEDQADKEVYRGMMRSAIAEGAVDLQDYVDFGHGIFNDLNVGSAQKVVDEMFNTGRWEEMFDAYDRGIENFWDWFREYFYGD